MLQCSGAVRVACRVWGRRSLTLPRLSPRSQPEKIKHLLDNIEAGTGKGSVIEKVEGMKYILAVRPWAGRRLRDGEGGLSCIVAFPRAHARARDSTPLVPPPPPRAANGTRL